MYTCTVFVRPHYVDMLNNSLNEAVADQALDFPGELRHLCNNAGILFCVSVCVWSEILATGDCVAMQIGWSGKQWVCSIVSSHFFN